VIKHNVGVKIEEKLVKPPIDEIQFAHHQVCSQALGLYDGKTARPTHAVDKQLDKRTSLRR